MEQWKVIPSLNGKYEASNEGRMRNTETGRISKFVIHPTGYFQKSFRISPTKKKTIRIHKLIAEAFLGQIPPKHVINHKDGNKQNNTPENLEYVTSSENNIHALKNGLRKVANPKKGASSPHAKLTEIQAEEILKFYMANNYGYRTIAKMLGYKQSTVQNLLNKAIWKDLKNKLGFTRRNLRT